MDNTQYKEVDGTIDSWKQIYSLSEKLMLLATRNASNEGHTEDLDEVRSVVCQILRIVTTQNPKINEDGNSFIPYERIINRKRRNYPSKTSTKSTTGKICSWCLTSETPEWRKGPQKEPLCNACGLQYYQKKKADEEQKKKFSVVSLLNNNDITEQ